MKLRNAGIGDENVDQPQVIPGLHEKALKVGGPAHIALNRQDVLTQIGHGLIERRAIAPEDDDFGAVGHKFARRRQTDAAVATSDHSSFAGKLHTFSPSLDTPRHSSRMPCVTSDGGSASIECIRGSHALNECTLEVPLRERRMNAEPLLRRIPYRGDRRLINWP